MAIYISQRSRPASAVSEGFPGGWYAEHDFTEHDWSRIAGSERLLCSRPRTDDMRPGQLIEEFIQKQFADALTYIAWLMDKVDPTQRLSHVAVAAKISDADYLGWRTERERAANPNTIAGAFGGGQRPPVHVSRPRAALRLDAARIVEDLIVPLRRQWR